MIMTKVGPYILIIGFGVTTLIFGLLVPKNTFDLLTTAALVSTLCAVIWYTIETRKLRVQQEFDSEIRNHPWLKGSNLKVEWMKDEGGLVGRDIIHFLITNVGTTPAYDLCVTVRRQLKGALSSTGESKFDQLVLAPSDTGHLKLCEIGYDDPADKAALEVKVSYKSFMEGGGRLQLTFFKELGKGWANGPMSPYDFWLADGRKFPLKV